MALDADLPRCFDWSLVMFPEESKALYAAHAAFHLATAQLLRHLILPLG